MSEKYAVLVDDCVYINEKVLRKVAERISRKKYVLLPQITMYMFDKIIKKAHEHIEEEVAE